MNYEFAKPLVRWVIDRANKITPTALDRALTELRLAYPAECTYAMMNLVDSHDTDRVSSMAKIPIASTTRRIASRKAIRTTPASPVLPTMQSSG